MSQKGCTYPVTNKLASASRPLPCGSTNGGYLIMAQVPYRSDDDPTNTPMLRNQMLCSRHACDVAAWKMVQDLPKTPFTLEELEYLESLGFEAIDLMPEGALDACTPRSETQKAALEAAEIDIEVPEDIIIDA